MQNMPGGQPQTQQPAPVDYKKSQTNILAELIPQIMNAMGGGDPYTTKLLQQQSMMNRQRNEKVTQRQNLRGFMRSVAMPATGKITPELIMEQAELWGVNPGTAMDVVQNFQKFRQGQKKEGFTLGAGQSRYDSGGNLIASMPGVEKTPFGSSKLGIYDKRTGKVVNGAPESQPALTKVPDGRGGWKFVRPTEGMAGLNNPGKGMRIESGPDGTIIQTNVTSDSSVLTPSAKSTIQKSLIEMTNTYGDLKSTMTRYDDSFLKGRDKLGFNITALKEKWDLGTVTSEDKDRLEEYTQFKRDSISTLNNYIKQITGAAMSREEAKRIMKGMPNPGMGLFDGDSPTEFKAKMDATVQQMDRVMARAHYTLRNGISDVNEIPLNRVDGVIDARGGEIELDLRKQYPDKSEQDITLLTTHALSKEFGIKL